MSAKKTNHAAVIAAAEARHEELGDALDVAMAALAKLAERQNAIPDRLSAAIAAGEPTGPLHDQSAALAREYLEASARIKALEIDRHGAAVALYEARVAQEAEHQAAAMRRLLAAQSAVLDLLGKLDGELDAMAKAETEGRAVARIATPHRADAQEWLLHAVDAFSRFRYDGGLSLVRREPKYGRSVAWLTADIAGAADKIDDAARAGAQRALGKRGVAAPSAPAPKGDARRWRIYSSRGNAEAGRGEISKALGAEWPEPRRTSNDCWAIPAPDGDGHPEPAWAA